MRLVSLVLVLALTGLGCGGGAAATNTTTTAAPTADIVDTAVAAGNFTTLARALEAAGLVETLKGPGPFTVLAPTDDAFAALPAGALDGLLANPEQLRAVLTYHVIAGNHPSSEVASMTSAPTVNGADVQIRVEGGTVHIGDATVTTADIMATNGVIHVIDHVLMPPAAAPAAP